MLGGVQTLGCREGASPTSDRQDMMPFCRCASGGAMLRRQRAPGPVAVGIAIGSLPDVASASTPGTGTGSASMTR